MSKSPCICLGNESWSKESVCKWPKNKAGTFKASKLTISDNFSINKSHQGPFQRLLTKFQKISDSVNFRVRKSYLETPANISKAQRNGSNSFAWVQDMTWPQLSPKQLISISHATPDIIPPVHYFHLSVFNPNLKIAMRMPMKWKMSKKKCLQMNQKEGRTLKNIITDHSRQLFLQTKLSRTLPEASYQISKNLRFCHF